MMVTVRWWMLVVVCGCGDNLDPRPSGDHHRYVVDREIVWSPSGHGDLSLGFGNSLGRAFDVLASERIRYVQRDVDEALSRGEVMEVVDLQVPHQDGLGLRAGFVLLDDLDPEAEPGKPLVMHFEDTLQGFIFASDRPGAMSIRMGLFGSIVELELIGARAEVSDPRVRPERVDGKIAGGVTKDDVQAKLLPLFHAVVVGAIARDCLMPQSPPLCGCVDSPDELQGGAYFVRMFDSLVDAEGRDCAVTLEELAANPWVYNYLYADKMIDGRAAMSFGFRFSASAIAQ